MIESRKNQLKFSLVPRDVAWTGTFHSLGCEISPIWRRPQIVPTRSVHEISATSIFTIFYLSTVRHRRNTRHIPTQRTNEELRQLNTSLPKSSYDSSLFRRFPLDSKKASMTLRWLFMPRLEFLTASSGYISPHTVSSNYISGARKYLVLTYISLGLIFSASKAFRLT